MFKFLNSRFSRAAKRIKNDKGQIAIIIILVIAVSIIFYAVALNFGQLSTNKAAVTMASNIGASMLGSQMASYGQYLFEVQLDGHEHLCAGTNILVMVLTLIVIIVVAIIAAPFTYGASLSLIFADFAIVGLALLAAAIIIQLTIVQPGITAMWNAMQQETLTQIDRVVEQAIGTGLQNIISDQEQVPDFWDYDQDTLWGLDPATGQARDEVARFVVYYTERLRNVPDTESLAVREFLKALAEFVFEDPFDLLPDGDPDAWGLYDPVGENFDCNYNSASSVEVPSVCNECCVPLAIENPYDSAEMMPVRNEFCDCIANGTCSNQLDEVGESLSGYCSRNSMYPDDDSLGALQPQGYRYTYDMFFENPENKFASFVEQLGVDDEVVNFYKNKADINHAQFRDPPVSPPVTGSYSHVDEFRIQDTSGYYFIHPSFEPPSHRLVYQVDYDAFTECLTHCSDKNCALESDGISTINGPLPIEPVYDSLTDTGYDYSGLPDFDETQDCNDSADPPTLNNSRGWRAAIIANRNRVVAPDGRRGIFPLFYKLRDWGLDLTKHGFEQPMLPGDFKPEYCHWYDNQYDTGATPCPVSGTYPLPEQLRFKPLDLPLDPYDPDSELVMNLTTFVDGKNIDVGGRRAFLAVDKVHLGFNRTPGEEEYIQLPVLAEEDECAQDAFDRLLHSEGQAINTQFGFWKAGSDKFCAPEDASDSILDDPDGIHWSYDTQCDRDGNTTADMCTFIDANPSAEDDPEDLTDPEVVDAIQGACECGGAETPGTNEQFHSDVLDDMVYGIRYFVDFATSLLVRDEDANVRDFKIWYAQAAPWIEPGTDTSWEGHGATRYDIDNLTPPLSPPPCFVCDEKDGALWYWYRQIQEFVERFQGLLDGPYMSAAPYDLGDDVCTQVWCGPPVDDTFPTYDEGCFEEDSSCVDFDEYGTGIAYECDVDDHFNWPVGYDVAQNCGYIWQDEKDEMGNNLNGVISCLDYNVARENPSEYFGAFLRLGDVVGYGIYDTMYMDLLNDMLGNGYITEITAGSSGRISETFTDDVPTVADFHLSPTLNFLVLSHRLDIYNIMLNNIENSLQTTPQRFQDCIDTCVRLSEWVEKNNAIIIDDTMDRVQPDDPTHDRSTPDTVWGTGGGDIIADQASGITGIIRSQTASACDCPISLHPVVATKAAQSCTDRNDYFLPRSLVYVPRQDGTVTRFNPSGEMDVVKQGVFNNYFDCKYRCFEGKMSLYEIWVHAYEHCLNDYNNCIDDAQDDADDHCLNTAAYTSCTANCTANQTAHDTCHTTCDTNETTCVTACAGDPVCIAGCTTASDCYTNVCDPIDVANGYDPNCTDVCDDIYDQCYWGGTGASWSLDDPTLYNGNFGWRADDCFLDKEGDGSGMNHDGSDLACEPQADQDYIDARNELVCGGSVVTPDVALSVYHDYVSTDGTIVDFMGNLVPEELNKCRGIAGLYCFDPDDGHFRAETSAMLYQNILKPSLGSCDETLSWEGTGTSVHVAKDSHGQYIVGGWLGKLQESIPEAINQGAKFKERSNFLKIIRNDIVAARNIFATAQEKFEELLTCADENHDGVADGAICELIIERTKNKPTGLPYQAIYGWEGEPPTNRPAPNEGRPYWHIVKVEARAPQRCDERCNLDQDGPKGWPYIKTYTKNWGLTRCFKVANKSGTVKFRVTRWDEDRDKGRVLTFPNGMPIWDFRFRNPEGHHKESYLTANSLPADQAAWQFIPTNCANSIIQATGFPAPHDDDYQGAFMLNEYSASPPNDNSACWVLAHHLLSDGIASETCAQYFWASERHGYSFKFVKCKDF